MSLIVFELFEMPTVMAVIDHFMCPVKMPQIYHNLCVVICYAKAI